jgi:uncharacterized protein (TIGR00251 family)
MERLVEILVKTNSKKQGIEKLADDRFKVSLTSEPEKGKANRELLEVLSKFFGIYQSRIDIVSGKTSKRKKVKIMLY